MKQFLFFLLLSSAAFSQSAKDTSDIRAAALHYVEGWYEGNAERVAKAIHPNLVKRNIGASMQIGNNQNVLQDVNAEQLIERTKRGLGLRTPKEMQIKNITILNIYNNSASVKAEMTDWYDFMHLTRWNGEWKIINVLWEMKPQL